MKPVYTKTPLSLPAQVQHLQDKGLHVPDPARAQLVLRRVELYRFKGFLLPYKMPSGYVPGTAFADVERLMTLDGEAFGKGLGGSERTPSGTS